MAQYLSLETIRHSSNIEAQAKDIAQQIRPLWKEKELKTRIFTKGLTNHLVGVHTGEEEKMILVKFFGSGSEKYIDREVEKRNMVKLHQAGLGAALLAEFPLGIAYSYTSGHTIPAEALQREEVWKGVARSLAKQHQITLEPDEVKAGIQLFPRIYSMIESLPDKKLVKSVADKKTLLQHYHELKKRIESLLPNAKAYFSHNDLVVNNILFDAETKRVSFIDYEFGFPNYRAYDIANHFVEHAGLIEPVKYSENYPSVEHQREWIREYLAGFKNEGRSEKEVEKLQEEIAEMAVLSHFFFTIWALEQVMGADISFDYGNYAKLRWQGYQDMKKRRMKK